MQQLYGFKPSQHALLKLTGSFFNPGPYAGYLAVVVPMAIYYWVDGTRMTRVGRIGADENSENNSNRWGLWVKSAMTIGIKIFAAVTCIAIILVLPAAMSRAAWLAAVAGSVIVLFMSKKIKIRVNQCHPRHLRSIVLAIIICLMICLVGIYYLKKDSADGRLLTWKVSLSVIKKHPFGVGLGHFPGAYGDAQAAYFASGKASETEEYVAGNPEYGFNEFLQIAIESGVISLLLFAGMIISAFRGLMKTRDWGVMGALAAMLVFAFFSYPFSLLPFLIVFVFLLVLSVPEKKFSVFSFQFSEKNKSVLIHSIRVICVPVLCVIVTAFCLSKQYPVYKAYKQWKSNQYDYQADLYEATINTLSPLYPYLNDRIRFLFEYGRSLSQMEHYEKSNEVLRRAMQISCDPMLYNIMGKNCQALKQYPEAEQCFIKSSHIVPSRLYPHYLLMKLYLEMGEEEKTKAAAQIVLTKEPKVPSTAVKEMRDEARKIIADYKPEISLFPSGKHHIDD